MTDAIRHRGPDDVGAIFGNAATGDYALFGGEDTPADVFGQPLAYAPTSRLAPGALGEASHTLGMANRRLAIVDLTPAGHQPMCNEDGTIWIVYNGELYNAAELRAELAALGHRFVSGSDTEAIVHAYETWGDAVLPASTACGGWRSGTSRGGDWCSRYRTGIKPLYLWQDAARFAFASEIKGLLALELPRCANETALYDFWPAT